MSGHSKWATTHRQKEAKDAKRGAIFTKLGNLITIAAREGGGDLDTNFKLRLAVDKAKAANLPKDNIDRAIKRGAGADKDAHLEEIAYEVFGPAGATFIAEAITDNKNRTSADIKTALNKAGGQLGGQNSVMWMFARQGLIVIDQHDLPNNPEELELKIIDAGAQDIIKDDSWEIYTAPDQLQKTITQLKSLNLTIKESGLVYVPKKELILTDPESQAKVEKIFSALENCDDINNVYTNVNW